MATDLVWIVPAAAQIDTSSAKSSGYYEFRASNFVGRAADGISHADSAAIADDPDALWRQYHATPIKLSHSSLIVQAWLTLDGVPTRVAYKRSQPISWWKRWAGVVRGNRAARAWRVARGLLDRGIPTAEPLLLCQPCNLLERGCGYLATRWIEGSTNLHLYLWDLNQREPAERRRRMRQLAVSLGRLLGEMHAQGVVNRDLKALNLVVVERPDSMATFLVDVDAMRFCRRVSDRSRAIDLARLATSLDMHPWVSRTDRLRFLRSYLAGSPLAAGVWQPFARRLAARSTRIKRRMARQGKALA